MAMDDLYSDPDAALAIARDASGRAQAFLHLVPSPAGHGWSLSAMRRAPGTPNGLMEYLVVQTVAWAAASGATEVSLNFCAFAGLMRARPERSLAARVARAGLLRADHLFQLARLLRFNAKFLPEWRPRYVCLQRLSDVPAVGLAWLHVESLLAPPALRPARTAATA
jgi:lysyl-tRNA synthetase class 2